MAGNFTSDIASLQVVFSLVYAAIPLLALLASWWVVREQAPHLFIWAALGMLLGVLPGQFFFIAEATIAIELIWPIWLAILIGVPLRVVPLVIVLTIAVLISHPFAIALFGLTALIALGQGFRFGAARHRLWLWALIFGGLMIANALYAVFSADSYEADQLSLDMLRYAFGSAVAGLPLLALGCSWLAALLLFLAPRVKRPLGRVLGLAALSGIAAAGITFLLWARSAELWKQALDFRYLVLFVELPFLGLAVAETLWPQPDEQPRMLWGERLRAAQTAALVFMLVLVLQSAVWFSVTNRLRDTIATSPWACVSAGPIAWINQTPLQHWSVSSYALLLQQRSPTKLLLTGDGCGSTDFSGSNIQINTWSVRQWDRGWFDLAALRNNLVGEQQNASGCAYDLTTGWHQTETNGPYWWRWSEGRDAQLRVLSEKDLNAGIYGQIETIRQPNQIDVLVNGTKQSTITLDKLGLQPLGPIQLPLKRGKNTISFISQNAPVETQGRPLAMSVANLTLASGDPALVCTFHP